MATLLPFMRGGTSPRPLLGLKATDGGGPLPSDDIDEMDDSELKPEWPRVMVPLRDMEMPGFAISASARSKTFPWNAAAKAAL